MLRQMEAENDLPLGHGAKVIMTSAMEDNQYILQALNASADGYVVKPIEKRKFIETLKEIGLLMEIRPPSRSRPDRRSGVTPKIRTGSPLAAVGKGLFLSYSPRHINLGHRHSETSVTACTDQTRRRLARRTLRNRGPLQVEAGTDLSRLGKLGGGLRRDRSRPAGSGKRQGTLAESGAGLLETIEAIHEAQRLLEKTFVFAGMKSDEDTRIGENTARKGRISSLAVRVSEAVSWFESEVLAIEPDRLAELVAEEPGLELYEHFFHNIHRAREHTLSAEQEALLAGAGLMARGASQVFNAFDNADLQFEPVQDEDGETVALDQGPVLQVPQVP